MSTATLQASPVIAGKRTILSTIVLATMSVMMAACGIGGSPQALSGVRLDCVTPFPIGLEDAISPNREQSDRRVFPIVRQDETGPALVGCAVRPIAQPVTRSHRLSRHADLGGVDVAAYCNGAANLVNGTRRSVTRDPGNAYSWHCYWFGGGTDVDMNLACSNQYGPGLG
jgi:hypothetical protein